MSICPYICGGQRTTRGRESVLSYREDVGIELGSFRLDGKQLSLLRLLAGLHILFFIQCGTPANGKALSSQGRSPLNLSGNTLMDTPRAWSLRRF